MQKQTKGLLLAHTAVLLLAGPGLIAEWISLPSIVTIFWRLGVAALVLSLVSLARGYWNNITRQEWQLFAVGAVCMAMHWWAFFEGIARSNAITGQIIFSLSPMVVWLTEPLFFTSERRDVRGFVLTLAGLLGVGFVIASQSPDLSSVPFDAIALGVLSVCAITTFSFANRKVMSTRHPIGAMGVQVLGAFGLIGLLAAPQLSQHIPNTTEWLAIVLLGVVFTAVAHTVRVASFQFISVHRYSLISNLIIVYVTALAWWLLGSTVNWQTLVGIGLVLGVSSLNARTKNKPTPAE